MANDRILLQILRNSFRDLSEIADTLNRAWLDRGVSRHRSPISEKTPTLRDTDYTSLRAGDWFAADKERLVLLDAAIVALAKAQAEAYPSLTDVERRGLEAVILLEGRPALLVSNGAFQSPPEAWKHLEDCRGRIMHCASRVGRIESLQNGVVNWHGTGFLIGPDAIITNRHVAELFTRREGTSWHFRSGCDVSIDVRREYGSDASHVLKCVAVVGVHESYDLAVLKTDSRHEAHAHSLEPLRAWGSPHPTLPSREVYVIGYPGRPAMCTAEIDSIFGGVYGVKRLLPGMTLGLSSPLDVPSSLMHDCSTLGGSSGSCVVDLGTHLVLGVHFGGQHLVENRAVPLWLLQEDALIKKTAVEFVFA